MRRLSPSLVISLFALFFSVAGTGVAGVVLISGSQIRNHSIPATKLTAAAVAVLHGQRGPVGANGTFDPTKITSVIGFVDVATSQIGTAVATCPSGSVAVSGGGFAVTGLNTSQPVTATGQTAPGAWLVQTFNSQSSTIRLTASAVCASP
jgi:hypothetical protein